MKTLMYGESLFCGIVDDEIEEIENSALIKFDSKEELKDFVSGKSFVKMPVWPKQEFILAIENAVLRTGMPTLDIERLDGDYIYEALYSVIAKGES